MIEVSKNFRERVLEVVSKIPRGEVLSYGEVSLRAGSIGAARAVGSIMSKNKDKNIPCHRVIKTDGSIGEYNGLQTRKSGRLSKMDILKKEGVLFSKTGKVLKKDKK